MDREEIKKQIKEKKIDRRDLAEKVGVSVSHLSSMLSGWSPMKDNYEKAIMKIVDENE